MPISFNPDKAFPKAKLLSLIDHKVPAIRYFYLPLDEDVQEFETSFPALPTNVGSP